MLACLSFYEGDADAALKLLEWIDELGGCQRHELMLGVVQSIDTSRHERAATGWAACEVYRFHDRCEVGWPFSANHAFRRCAEYIEYSRGDVPFLWLESDAIPLRSDWLDAIEAEYARRGAVFMGYMSRKGLEGAHMNGVGVWRNPSLYAPSAMRAPFPQGGERVPGVAFDQAAGAEVLASFAESDLFQFEYRKESRLWEQSPEKWLKPEAAIFHTEKTGKLIDWLRANKHVVRGAQPASRTTPSPKQPANLAEEPQNSNTTTSNSHCVFIKSYAKDTEWLRKSLQSIEKTARGVSEIVVVTDDQTFSADNVRVIFQAQGSRGYIEQQYVKLTADTLTDCDYITYSDSDVIYKSSWSLENLLEEGKPVWRLTPRSEIKDRNHPWWPVMRDALGKEPEYEFMRRHPHTVKREHLAEFRDWMHRKHGIPLVDFMYSRIGTDFSEFNVLGFWLYEHKRGEYFWADDTCKVRLPEVTQYHSWTQSPKDIKTVEGDTHIGKWVQEAKSMNHGDYVAREVAKLLKPGDWVVDCGANIRTHASLYAMAVGASGRVIAFEPNPKARECLEANVEGITVYPYALGEAERWCVLKESDNVGASTVEEAEKGNIKMRTLDSFNFAKVALLKLDVEGWEERALMGAQKLIKNHRPIIVCEINKSTGTTLRGIKNALEKWGYDYKIVQPECNEDSEMYDVICTPLYFAAKRKVKNARTNRKRFDPQTAPW